MRFPLFAPEIPTPPMLTFATHVRPHARPGSRAHPPRLHQARRRSPASRIGNVRQALATEAHRSVFRTCSPAAETFVAETRCREIRNSSLVSTDAQSCAQLESPRARVPSCGRRGFFPATALRAPALQPRSRHFPAAYAGGNRTALGLALWELPRNLARHLINASSRDGVRMDEIGRLSPLQMLLPHPAEGLTFNEARAKDP